MKRDQIPTLELVCVYSATMEQIMSSFLNSYGAPNISEDDIASVVQSLRKPIITRGELVRQFEEEVAEYVQAPYAVAFSNGSSALWAAYAAANLTKGDCVVTSSNTFVSTASYAPLVGASVDFIDIDLDSGNLNIDEVHQRLTKRKSQGKYAIAPVHFAGRAVDMKRLQQGIEQENTVVIEDAAHALGSFYPTGESVGCGLYSDMTIFSFHPVKNITTAEGGMVTTQSKELYTRLLQLRNSGIERESLQHLASPEPWYYEVHHIACQAHMTELQAALGLSQLKRLPEFVEKRRNLVKRYRQHLTNVPGITLFSDVQDKQTAYHLFVAQIEFERFGFTRTSLMQRLASEGIGTQLHYVPMYYHSIFGKQNIEHANTNMQIYFQRALTLPLHVGLTVENIDEIATKLKKILFNQL